MAAIRLAVAGDYALFTRPEMKVERVSYDVMTPSAARGALEAILWRPEFRWIVTRIVVLKPIRWDSIRRNEVKDRASLGRASIIVDDDDQRQQRAALVLRDVEYVIHARIAPTAKAGPDDTPAKYRAMFLRRAEAGQCFQQPYLGCREFAARFRPLLDGEPDPEPAAADDRDLGWMLHDYDYAKRPPEPRFFHARLERGRLNVPAPDAEGVRA